MKDTLLVFALSFVSKIFGLIKSIIQASIFGSTFETDAFNVANEFVSNVLFMLATVIAVVFVPAYIQKRETGEAKPFASKSITGLLIVAIFLTIALLLVAPLIVRIIAPSYQGRTYDLTVNYFRILTLCFVFALITQLYSNLMNANKVYGYSAFCSIINSLVLIAFIMIFAPNFGVWALVVAVPVSYFFQFVILFIKGRKYARITLKEGIWDNSIRQIISRAIPVLVGQASVEINQVVDRALFTSLGEGVLTALTYSIVLYQFVSALITAPLSTVMFTELSEAGANMDIDGIRNILNTCFKLIAFICVPIVLTILFTSVNVVSIIYGHGKFDYNAVHNCATGLRIYCLCLLPVCFKTVLSRAYYAINDTRRPMMIGMMQVTLNILLSILLIRWFGIVGVAGATAIASVVFIIVMLIDYSKKYINVSLKSVVFSYWKIGISGLITGVVLFLINDVFIISNLLDFVCKTVIGFTLYLLILFVTKEPVLDFCVKKCINVIKKRRLE